MARELAMMAAAFVSGAAFAVTFLAAVYEGRMDRVLAALLAFEQRTAKLWRSARRLWWYR